MRVTHEAMNTHNSSDEVGDWLLSLIIAGAIYAIYVVLIMQTNLDKTSLYLAFGAATGFVALESYWIFRGWHNHHRSTVVMGVAGIVITLCVISLIYS